MRLDQQQADASLAEAKRRLSAESEQRLQDFIVQLQEREAAAKQQLQAESRCDPRDLFPSAHGQASSFQACKTRLDGPTDI